MLKMIRRSLWYLLLAFAVVAVLWVLVVLLNSGGIDRDFTSGTDYAWADEMPGATCSALTIPVKLSADSFFAYDLVGRYCAPAGADATTLQLLVSGAGYGIAYWDFPYRPDTYSYARAALRRGDAVFNFDRLGMGLSDHPPGILLDVDSQAYVLQQVITALQREHAFTAVVTLGHSFGSTIALAHALTYPEQVNGIVLTGFLHNVNPAFGPSIGRQMGIAAFSEPLAGKLWDPTYVITREGGRENAFYTPDATEAAVIATDDATRETTALGELISMSRYFGDQSRALSVPVMVLVGENDSVVCGGSLDCTDHEATRQHETAYYPRAACPEVYVLDDTNHNANLHRNAPDAFALMLDWVGRRAGSAGLPPAEPCSPGTTYTDTNIETNTPNPRSGDDQ